MIAKLSYRRLCRVFLGLVVILLSGHALQTILSGITNLLLVTGMLGILIFLQRLKKGNLDSNMGFLLLFMLMIICTIVVDFGRGLRSYVTYFCMVLTGYCIAEMYPFRKMVFVYQKIMLAVTIVSLVCYYLVNYTSVLDFLPKMMNINDKEFAVGLIFNYLTSFPERNCGMFWEPGVFASFLTWAIVFELLFVEKTRWSWLLLFSIAIFTANSSAGYALFFLCVLLALVRNYNSRLGTIRLLFSCYVLLAAIIIILNFDLILYQTVLADNVYFQKLTMGKIVESSRYEAVFHNLKIFASSPLFGAGIVTVSEKMTRTADTSTSTYLMSVFGVLGSLYTLGWLKGILKIKRINVFSKILLLTIVMIILNKEPHHQILFSWCMFFYFTGGTVDKEKQLSTIINESSE